MLDKKLVLVGYSGHGFVVAEAALMSGLNLKFYSEMVEITSNPFDLSYLGFEGDNNFKYWNSEFEFILGIGNNKLRQQIANLIMTKNGKILNVIHPTASISQKIHIGFGNLIARNVAINPLVSIGNFCILNTGCIIEHECQLANGVHIAPGAVLAGNVKIGENTFVGANSVIKQGIKIGKDVIIGAGSVIIKDIADNKKIVGNPSREI